MNETISSAERTSLPVRAIVLYKHGIGYVTRQGTASAGEIALFFRPEDVDDALKSLTVLTVGGGTVMGAHYATPHDRQERLAEIPLELGDKHALFDLLNGLRGATVSLALHGGDAVRGRIVGLEQHPQGQEHQATFLLQTGPGGIQQVPTGEIAGLTLDDERAASDLERYLDAARVEDARRPVTVVLDEPGRHVQVSYTVPSPVWRVSYRLVGGAAAGEGDRRGLLQGWGIFDNRLDEDLEDVEVALVAGQPVSFRYDLTSSVIPEREFVPDQSRPAAGPIEFAGALAEAPAEYGPMMAGRRVMETAAGPAAMIPAAIRSRAARYSGYDVAQVDESSLAASTGSAAAASAMDELFEYRVGGVSVKRDESAMIPVVQDAIGYRRELLYNGSKHPNHPIVSLRLKNTSGLTLERGPVTVFEDGAYRGEAILPFTRADGEIVLAFAVELGVRVVEDHAGRVVISSIRLDRQYLHIQQQMYHTTTYRLMNSTAQDQEVTLEQPKQHPGAELFETRDPDEDTGEERRWRVPCPAHRQTEFQVTQREIQHRTDGIFDQSLANLSAYLEHRFLDAETRKTLETALNLRQRLADIEKVVDRLLQEREALGVRQDRLRKNLTIQPSNEQEQTIRRRSAEAFGQAQDREQVIEEEIERLQAEKREIEERLDAEIRGLK